MNTSHSVSLKDVVVIGTYFDASWAGSEGAPGIRISGSDHIDILKTSATGGPGGLIGYYSYGSPSGYSGRGGDGLMAVQSTSVSIDSSTISGGEGKPSDSTGYSVRLEDSSRVFLSNSQLHFDYAVDSSSVLTVLNYTGVETSSTNTPASCLLQQNYPNPFNPLTTIRYRLPNRSFVMLTVCNFLGQQVVQLVNGEMDPGFHEVRFDGVGLSSGVYIYRLQAGMYVEAKKCVLVK